MVRAVQPYSAASAFIDAPASYFRRTSWQDSTVGKTRGLVLAGGGVPPRRGGRLAPPARSTAVLTDMSVPPYSTASCR